MEFIDYLEIGLVERDFSDLFYLIAKLGDRLTDLTSMLTPLEITFPGEKSTVSPKLIAVQSSSIREDPMFEGIEKPFAILVCGSPAVIAFRGPSSHILTHHRH